MGGRGLRGVFGLVGVPARLHSMKAEGADNPPRHVT